MDLEEIISRINPQYQDVRGTESYERKWLCDEIERLRKERDEALEREATELLIKTGAALAAQQEIESLRQQLAECQRERDELVSWVDGVIEIVELFKPDTPSQVKWREKMITLGYSLIAKLGAEKGEVGCAEPVAWIGEGDTYVTLSNMEGVYDYKPLYTHPAPAVPLSFTCPSCGRNTWVKE